jgi:hypothetical protein
MGKLPSFLHRGILLSLVLVWIVPPASPTAVPADPSNLIATAASQTHINLTRTDNSNNEDGFKIERSPNGIDDWEQIGMLSAGITSYVDFGLSCGTLYYYRVRAFNIDGHSGYSNVANTSTIMCTPDPPSDLTAVAVSPIQIDLE